MTPDEAAARLCTWFESLPSQTQDFIRWETRAMTVHSYFCAGTRAGGEPCGRKVGKPGDRITRYCWQHNGSRPSQSLAGYRADPITHGTGQMPDCSCGHPANAHPNEEEPACEHDGCPCEHWYEGRDGW